MVKPLGAGGQGVQEHRGEKTQGNQEIATESVLIEAFSALPAQFPREHHALEERRRGEHRVLVLVEHDVRDVVRRVEADEIEQRQRPHRVAAAELHALVDVLDRPQATLVASDRVQQIRHQQAVDDEARLVGGGGCRFRRPRAEDERSESGPRECRSGARLPVLPSQFTEVSARFCADTVLPYKKHATFFQDLPIIIL